MEITMFDQVNKVLTVVVLLMIAPTVLSVDELPVNEYHGSLDSPYLYYRTGGGLATSMPVVQRRLPQQTVQRKKAIFGLTCNGFDPRISIANMMNEMKNGAQDTYNEILGTVKGTMINMPGMILQRSWPDWYSEFRRNFRAKYAKYNRAIQACNRTLSSIQKNGSTPPFFSISQQEQLEIWNDQRKKGIVDPVKIKAEALKQQGQKGVAWTCGEIAGGKGQAAMYLMAGPIQTGYNELIGRACNAKAQKIKRKKGERLDDLSVMFPTYVEAQQWAKRVFGEQVFNSCSSIGCQVKSQGAKLTSGDKSPGIGILKEINFEKERVFKQLKIMVFSKNSNVVTPENLRKITEFSAPLHPKHITILREAFTPHDRVSKIWRVASEIATQKVLMKTRAVWRMLIYGQRDPNVASFYDKNNSALNPLKIVERELKVIEQDIRLVKQFSYPYLYALLQYQDQRKANAGVYKKIDQSSSRSEFKNGSIIRSKEVK